MDRRLRNVAVSKLSWRRPSFPRDTAGNPRYRHYDGVVPRFEWFRSHPRISGVFLGALADAVFGDPQRRHPVALFGHAARRLEPVTYRDSRRAGVVHVAGLVGPLVVSGVIADAALRHRPGARIVLTAAATWAAMCGTTLRRECLGILRPLRDGDLVTMRERMPRLFFADAPDFGDDDVLRETITTLTENTLDAAIGPLFWSAVAGPAGALGYRTLNNLDGLIGFPAPRYGRFGWATARLDDVVNWVPARLAGLAVAACAPFVGGSPRRSWRVMRRDARVDPSPNSGVLYAAFCGALDITLARPNRVTERPRLYVFGDGRAPDVEDAFRTVRLSRAADWACVVAALTALLALSARPGTRA